VQNLVAIDEVVSINNKKVILLSIIQLFTPPNFGFVEYGPPSEMQYQQKHRKKTSVKKLQKGISLCGSASFEPSNIKIGLADQFLHKGKNL